MKIYIKNLYGIDDEKKHIFASKAHIALILFGMKKTHQT